MQIRNSLARPRELAWERRRVYTEYKLRWMGVAMTEERQEKPQNLISTNVTGLPDYDRCGSGPAWRWWTKIAFIVSRYRKLLVFEVKVLRPQLSRPARLFLLRFGQDKIQSFFYTVRDEVGFVLPQKGWSTTQPSLKVPNFVIRLLSLRWAKRAKRISRFSLFLSVFNQ